jgi:hypothetical protein
MIAYRLVVVLFVVSRDCERGPIANIAIALLSRSTVSRQEKYICLLDKMVPAFFALPPAVGLQNVELLRIMLIVSRL